MADLPSALRAGGGRGDGTHGRPTPRRSSTSNSRLSDLLSTDSRRVSEVSFFSDLPNEPPRRYSTRRDVSPPESELVSPVSTTWSPARENSLYSRPSIPALPSLFENRAYQPLPPLNTNGPEDDVPSSKRRSLIGRFGSIHTGRATKGGRYGVLDDDDDVIAILSPTSKHRRLHSVDEETESIGIDLSGFEGPKIELQNMYQATSQSSLQRTGTLGRGMDHVIARTVMPAGHKRGNSLVDVKTKRAGLREAQEAGTIVEVSEVVDMSGPAVDISNLGGSQYDSRSSLGKLENPDKEPKKSYFFPKDPEKPSWKPISMRWPYITLLVLIAVFLACLQELLCQISIRRGGLLKFHETRNVPTQDYFAWKYMPTMILVSYGLLWNVVDFEVKRLEAYYQLSKREGATAGESLNLDYLTFMSYLIPVVALKNRQWAVALSSIATLLAGSAVPILQSASVGMYPKHSANPNIEKAVKINPVWSRFLTAVLGVVAIHGLLLMVSLRRKSGLISDPKGIAGIASMATKSHILTDFNGLDVATNATIHKQLRTRRYNLHKSSLWQGEYIKASEKLLLQDKAVENPHPIMLRLSAGIPYITYMLVFMGLIPVLVFVPGATIATEKVPFLMTTLATVVKLLWGTLDMSVRVVEPYFVLSNRHAPPSMLTLDYTGTVPGYLTYRATKNGHFLVAVVGLGAILAEVLTVCVTSFSVDGRKFISGQGGNGNGNEDRANTGETFRSFWISFGMSLFILIYLIVVAVIVYMKRKHHFLPRQPGSIAGVLAYIHQSRMLDDFVDTEGLDSRQMTSHLEKIGKTYALGWFNGRDGEDHCGVDQEPIMARYKHGYDWKKSRIAGEAVGGWEYL